MYSDQCSPSSALTRCNIDSSLTAAHPVDNGKSGSHSRTDGRTKGYRADILGRIVTSRNISKLIYVKQRIEPFGWDTDDRTYIVLDDNRLYRRTDPPPPPPPTPKPKKNSKKAKAALRASKRRKYSELTESEAEPTEDPVVTEQGSADKEDDGFGGMTWECIAVTLNEFTTFISSIEKSRDPNEKILRNRLIDDVLPLLEKQEEARKRKQAQKERELLNLEKLAHAKRSGRIASKLEQQKKEDETREADRKKHAELAMAKKEQERWMKLEKERESRMMTREQRLKEREARRILHEEELANLSEDSKKLETGQGRLSERHLKAEIEKKKQALEQLAEEEDWIFDCICGAYGQIDDGTHSIACDKCNIWQHSKCVGVSQAEADREDFHFVCSTCQRKAKDEERAKNHPPIKIKLNNRPGVSSSPVTAKQNSSPAVVTKTNSSTNLQSPLKEVEPAQPLLSPTQTAKHDGQRLPSWQNAPYTLKEQPVAPSSRHTVQSLDSVQNMASAPVERAAYTGPYGAYPKSSSSAQSPYAAPRPLSSHSFPSPLPHSPTNLAPPGQPQLYTWINGSSSQNNNNLPHLPPSQSTPIQQHDGSGLLETQSSPSLSSSHGNGASFSSVNGARPLSGEEQRRGSINLPSPLLGAPVLTPSNKMESGGNFSVSGNPSLNFIISPQLTKSSPDLASSPLTVKAAPLEQFNDRGHVTVLPPAATGISPTKHSPPRSTALNGSFDSATPSSLPPVASLVPSPQHQNLTPPIKLSEPGKPLQASQSFSP